MSDNIYVPRAARIIQIKDEVSGERPIKTFRMQFVDGGDFSFRCGQCAMLSVFGRGESMISISSSPLVKDYLQFSILKMGRVTASLHEMQVGGTVGIRGPYGNSFPLEQWRGKNLVFIGGGIGLAPIWSVLTTTLAGKDQYAGLTLIYGARTSRDLVFREEIEDLRKEIAVHLSVDVEESGWSEFVGFVPQNVTAKKPPAENAVALVCGPPVMIKFVIRALKELGFADQDIYTTVENKMKCGVGKCGRCNIGSHYVCKDGPVYSWAQLKTLPES
jgi:sulfhydrogenase subunit gamma (sulfur reductase)